MVGWLGIMVAVVAAYIPFSYQYIKAELRDDPTYRRRVAKSLTAHVYLGGYRDRLENALSFFATYLGDLYSWRGTLQGILVCYLIATAYSSFFFLFAWSLGGPEGIGDTEFLPESPRWLRATWLAGAISLTIALFIWPPWANFKHGSKGSQYAFLIVGILGSQLILLFGTLLVRNTEQHFSGIILFGSLAIALFTVALFSMIKSSLPVRKASIVFVFILTILFLFSIVFSLLSPGLSVLSLFFVYLPLTNMVLDWPSWWISRWLGHHLIRQTSGANSRIAGFLLIGIHVLIDLSIAITLLFGLAVALPLVIELLNLLGNQRSELQNIELRSLITQTVQAPWPNALWIGLMLLSTLCPTLLHAGALIASPLAFWLVPDNQKYAIQVGLTVHNDPNPDAIRYAAWHQVHFWIIAIAAPIALLALFIWTLSSLTGGIARHLIWAADIGIWLAHWLAVA